MGDSSVKEKYKAGKHNYQQRVKAVMDETPNALFGNRDDEGKRGEFSLKVWVTYNLLCTFQDRKEIKELVGKRIEEGRTKLNNMNKFYKYVDAKPFRSEMHKFENKQNVDYWFEIYNIMREALAYRYAGRKTTVREEDMQENLDEGPDEFEDGMEEVDMDLDEIEELAGLTGEK